MIQSQSRSFFGGFYNEKRENWVGRKPPGRYLTRERKRHKNLSGILGGCLSRGENDLVDEEEDHHRDTAVEHGGTDIVDEVRHQMPHKSIFVISFPRFRGFVFDNRNMGPDQGV